MIWRIWELGSTDMDRMVKMEYADAASEMSVAAALNIVFGRHPEFIGKNFIVDDDESRDIYILDDPEIACYDRYEYEDSSTKWNGADEYMREHE